MLAFAGAAWDSGVPERHEDGLQAEARDDTNPGETRTSSPSGSSSSRLSDLRTSDLIQLGEDLLKSED